MQFSRKFKRNTLGVAMSIGLLSVPFAAQAATEYPDFDGATSVLNLPMLSINKQAWYSDVQIELNLGTGQFTLLGAAEASAPVADAPQACVPSGDGTPEVPDDTSAALAIDEIEGNDSFDSAQILSSLGANSPVEATIGTSGDVDFYAFDVVAGRTYTLELFDVANNLSLREVSYSCGGSYRPYNGLLPILYDTAENEIQRRCSPNGTGNVHSSFTFTAGLTSTYKLRVAAHADSVLGTYSLRILPKFDEPAAAWSSTSFEPNNAINNAYPLQVGMSNALNSQIEGRNSQFSNVYADVDSYRIVAQAGESFSVEFFDVANNLSLTGVTYDCGGSYTTYSGLFPRVLDPAGNEITRQCQPNGEGDVHTMINFTAGIDGDYFIKVSPHEQNSAGTYSIRVIKQ